MRDPDDCCKSIAVDVNISCSPSSLPPSECLSGVERKIVCGQPLFQRLSLRPSCPRALSYSYTADTGGDYLSAEGDEATDTIATCRFCWRRVGKAQLCGTGRRYIGSQLICHCHRAASLAHCWQIGTRRYCSTFERFSVVKQEWGCTGEIPGSCSQLATSTVG